MRAVVALLLVAAAPAPGPERPLLAPTREVSVLYQVSSSPTKAYEIRITSQPGNARRRIDLPDKNYLVVDQAAQRMVMVSPFEGTVIEVPWSSGLGLQFTLDQQMHFVRRSSATIAGLRCTTYTVRTPTTFGEVCVTDDGVMLRTLAQNAAGERTAIEAISVSFTPAPKSDYAPPPDFQRVAPAQP